ncbi:hypothetical protein F4803DRAFT_121503 [Xylaria telfairii]|nr:hypothetical protein F4803DRAFT_121503 [Xylaria telfairii]
MAERQRVLACPYLFKDYNSHLGCRKYELSRIRDVKQHLSRQHRRPPYCPRCYTTFNKEKERDEHLRAQQQCEFRAPVGIDGLSDSQQNRLSKRANSKQTVEEQWYIIWDTLFPNTAHPDSVYLDKTFSDEMFRLRQYMANEGINIFSNVLKGCNVMPGTSQNDEGDLASFQRDIAREVLGKLFEVMDDIQQPLPQRNPLHQAGPSHESQAPASARMADTNDADPPQDQDQIDHASRLDTHTLVNCWEIDNAARTSELPSQSESEFEELWIHLSEPELIIDDQFSVQYTNA